MVDESGSEGYRRQTPDRRAKELGLIKDGKDGLLEQFVGEAVVSQFENNDGPPTSDQSYRLVKLGIQNSIYHKTDSPSLWLVPPEGSKLHPITVNIANARSDIHDQPYPRSEEEKFRLLDAYEAIQRDGIIVDPENLEVQMWSSDPEQDFNKTIHSFEQKYPRSNSLVPQETKTAALEDWQRIRSEYEQEQAELQLRQQERDAKMDALARAREEEKRQQVAERKEKEGHNFIDGLQKYAARSAQEMAEREQSPIERSLAESVHALMWVQKEGEIVPGPLFTEEGRKALMTLYPVEQEQLDSNPRSALQRIEHFLTQQFLKIKKDPSTGRANLEGVDQHSNSKKFDWGHQINDEDLMIDPLSIPFDSHYMTEHTEPPKILLTSDTGEFTKLTVSIAHPVEETTAALLDDNGNPTGKTIEVKPVLRGRITKAGGEQRTVYRTPAGVVVLHPEEGAQCYPYTSNHPITI